MLRRRRRHGHEQLVGRRLHLDRRGVAADLLGTTVAASSTFSFFLGF
jgi:hypothetical protein